jgi:manganese/zinc/iron transport system ATP- binding protein
MNSILDVDSLHVNLGKKTVLWDLSFSIPQGAMVGILGPNGAGKSTLLKAVLGLVKRFSGRVRIGSKRIAYVPQRASVDWDFPISAIDVALMGRTPRFGGPKEADREAALEALDRVGLLPLAGRLVGELSGGQQQRLFLARALMQDPELYLLDEPFAGVDAASERAIFDLLLEEKKLGKTLLIVHHDLGSIKEYFDFLVVIQTRLIAAGPTAEVFTKETLEKAFGRGIPLFEEVASLSTKRREGW